MLFSDAIKRLPVTEIALEIETAINEKFGYDVPVMIRTVT